MRNENTVKSKDWRKEQREKFGHVPKLIWIHPMDWAPVKAMIAHLKTQRAKEKAP